MKKQCLIVLATVATMVIGLGSLASVQGSEIISSVPGNTVVEDPQGDLLLRGCDPEHRGIPCSLFPGEGLDLPGYFDIKEAKITQISKGQVDLHITLYEPIPAVPSTPDGTPYGFVSYIWQFAGGCVDPQPGNKDSISVVWTYWEDNQTWEWRAYWYVITKCDPSREIQKGDLVPFKFTVDGVKVRVALTDILTAIDPDDGYLEWHAAVRRLPFIRPPFTSTIPVDFAPDVEALNPAPPPILIEPEDFATWEPR